MSARVSPDAAAEKLVAFGTWPDDVACDARMAEVLFGLLSRLGHRVVEMPMDFGAVRAALAARFADEPAPALMAA